ncbi:stage II sporulation protein M [Halobacteriales archaeon QS_4_62_28]|nr:MAG: stage II sporulation protein M [Halobacteriales archaeon QS_4_62_28]
MRRRHARAIAGRWLRGYVPAATALFAVSIALGFLLGTQVPAELLRGDAGGSPFFPDEITFGTILVNNLIAITVTLLGVVSIGLFSGFVLVLNGIVVGAVAQIAMGEVSALTVFVLIAPHGIVEIPAILLVAAIGFRFGHRTYLYIRGRTDELVTGQEIREAAVLYAVAVVMIVVAAWIEAEVTLRLAEQIGR